MLGLTRCDGTGANCTGFTPESDAVRHGGRHRAPTTTAAPTDNHGGTITTTVAGDDKPVAPTTTTVAPTATTTVAPTTTTVADTTATTVAPTTTTTVAPTTTTTVRHHDRGRDDNHSATGNNHDHAAADATTVSTRRPPSRFH
jgi:hypothetical protein